MKKWIAILGSACLAGCLAGCNNGSETQPNTTGAEKFKIGFVGGRPNDYWSLVRFGCDTAALTLGNVKLDFRTPSGHTPADQQLVLSNLVASGVQAVALSPIDSQAESAFLNSIPTNVLLVCADNDAPASRRAAYIGTDNVAAGMQAAGLLKSALPGGGKVVLFVGTQDAKNARDRIQGIKQGLAGTNIQIIDTLLDGMNPAAALENAQAALAKHPDVAGMLGLFSYDGPAILRAVRGANKAGQIKIVCFDANRETLDGISSGDIFGSIAQSPYKIGHGAITFMAKYLQGDKTALAGGNIFIPTQAVTKENVEEYLRLESGHAP
jgi:ribose transport system substrate-binding protein